MKMKHIAALMATMAAAAVSVMPMSASAEMKDSYTFQLVGYFGTVSDWDGASDNMVTVDHDGTYTIVWEVDEPVASVEGEGVLCLDSDVNIYDYAAAAGGDGISDGTVRISIDSVAVDGNVQPYTQSANAVCSGDDNTSLRVNLNNQWGKTGAIADLNMAFTVESELTVTFTVEGLFPESEETTEAPATETTAAADTTTAVGSTTTAVVTTNAATGDTGIAAAAAILAAAGGMILISRKSR